MSADPKPPRWQEGSMTIDLAIPGSRTTSGRDERATLSLSWNVRPTRLASAREVTDQHIEDAKGSLANAAYALSSASGREVFDYRDLQSAIMHAIAAWCGTHLRGKGVSNSDDFNAFTMKAPPDLVQLESDARYSQHRYLYGRESAEQAYEATRIAVDALLQAAKRPPRNKRRYPVRYRAGRPLRKPRVKPGSWIDTGRYRPAEVLEIASDPPHTMTISYGDEIDDDFRPHIVHWKSVRKPRKPRSLKDVFKPGDWIRDVRLGYARVLNVHNTTLEIDIEGKRTHCMPRRNLDGLSIVDGPVQKDTRPFTERFAVGTWVERDGIDVAVVLEVDAESVLLFSPRSIFRVVPDLGPVLWVLDRPPLDPRVPRDRRRLWWLHHGCPSHGCIPCPCCGYPNLGGPAEPGRGWIRCVICGWRQALREEPGFVPVELEDLYLPMPDSDWFTEWEWANPDYTLAEARTNFENGGTMFRPDDPEGKPFAEGAELRNTLKRLLDDAMSVVEEPKNERWTDIRALVESILASTPEKTGG